MIVEVGHFALILAGALAVLLATVPMIGSYRNNLRWMTLAGNLAAGQLVFTAASFAVLSYAFATDDFSVAYVARNSNTLLPLQYKLSAVWGAHEGSFLLWTLIMAIWTFAVAVGGRTLPLILHARVLAVMGFLFLGFVAFLLFTSNPFTRLLPVSPAEGADLNPLLQDFGLIVHPPLLYAGYVGFSVPFAMAVAALLGGKLDAAWARWSRPWTNVAWAFLTIGIALGSWWAYYELGWGGWWFWDPVENASFMPWLVGTALVHSLAVTEKRGVFKSWTVLLAIFTFSLSLLGAFIVRSGVLTSVHAFAVDPERGLFILGFLLLVVGGSLSLYALRAPVMAPSATFGGWSREVLLLANNLLLVVSMGMVLLGTLAPLGYEAITAGDKISVGPPYFNLMFLPLMTILALLLALSGYVRWKQTDPQQLIIDLRSIALVSLVLAVIIAFVFYIKVNWQLIVATALGFWIVLAHGQELLRWRGRRPPFAHWGMTIAHIGFAVTLVGVCVTSHTSSERDVRLSPGESLQAGGYEFRFDGVAHHEGPNYISDRGTVSVLDGERLVKTLHPEKRRYLASGSVMTEAAIDPGFFGDFYVALGEPFNDGAWSVRVHVKPLVRWVWFGALLMGLGGVLAVLDPRYRRLKLAANVPRTQPVQTA